MIAYRVTYSAGAARWTTTLRRLDAGTLSAACIGRVSARVLAVELEADHSRGELLGVGGRAVGTFTVERVEVT